MPGSREYPLPQDTGSPSRSELKGIQLDKIYALCLRGSSGLEETHEKIATILKPALNIHLEWATTIMVSVLIKETNHHSLIARIATISQSFCNC